MKFNIYYIQKKLDSSELAAKYAKLISPYAKLTERNVFNKTLAASEGESARAATSAAYLPLLANAYNIALCEDGKMLSSVEFSQLLSQASSAGAVNFFIGGAYGLEPSFCAKCDYALSLSRLTTSHFLARVFLLEQLYRACTIQAAHPYHK